MDGDKAFCTKVERGKLLDFGWTKMNQKIKRRKFIMFIKIEKTKMNK